MNLIFMTFFFLSLFFNGDTVLAEGMNGPSCRVWAQLTISKDKSVMSIKITKTKRYHFWGLKGDCTFLDNKKVIVEDAIRLNREARVPGTYFIESGVERSSHKTADGVVYGLIWQPIMFTADSSRLDIEALSTKLPR